MEAIHKSANRYPTHDLRYGYGIPDFKKVLQLLGVLSIEEITKESKLVYYPNPVNDKVFFSNYEKVIRNVEFYDIAGKLIKNLTVDAHQSSVDVKEMGKGFIIVKVKYENGTSEVVKVVKY